VSGDLFARTVAPSTAARFSPWPTQGWAAERLQRERSERRETELRGPRVNARVGTTTKRLSPIRVSPWAAFRTVACRTSAPGAAV
jgi:hypothetical protein